MLKNLHKADQDNRWAEAVKGGDEQSFAFIYDKYAPALLGIILKMVENKDLAEHTLQQSFVNAWNKISEFNPVNNSLFTWLINIARNTAQAQMQLTQASNPGGNNFVHDADYNCISTLDTQAAVFELVYHKKMSCIDVANTLSISMDEVKINLKKAVQSLRNKVVTC